MIKNILLLFIIVGSLFGDEIFVEKHFIDGTKKVPRVNPGLMKLISLAETSGKANTIAFLATPDQAKPANDLLNQIGVNHRVQPYDAKRYIFSIWPKENEALNVFSILRVSGVNSYDIGLTQVNSLNARRNGWDEMRLLSDLSYNVEKGASILNDCMSNNSQLESAIECYNKGSHKQYSYTYYKRIFEIARR